MLCFAYALLYLLPRNAAQKSEDNEQMPSDLIILAVVINDVQLVQCVICLSEQYSGRA